MATKFIVNGVEHELVLVNPGTGLDYSADYIGNTEHGMPKNVEGYYIATAEDFAWWSSQIERQQAADNLIHEYETKYGRQAVSEWLDGYHIAEYDLELQPEWIKRALQAFDDDATPNRYFVDEAMLGDLGTEAQARRMVEFLRERGYDVEYGQALG